MRLTPSLREIFQVPERFTVVLDLGTMIFANWPEMATVRTEYVAVLLPCDSRALAVGGFSGCAFLSGLIAMVKIVKF